MELLKLLKIQKPSPEKVGSAISGSWAFSWSHCSNSEMRSFSISNWKAFGER